MMSPRSKPAGVNFVPSPIMKFSLFIFLFLILHTTAFAQTILADGEQPQVTVDTKGIVRIVFGKDDQVFYSASNDHGITFSKPVVIAQVGKMHLGMTRGPQLASSRDYSVVTAMDEEGTIHSYILDHQSGAWTMMKNVNDVDGSAPEGLMGIAADDNNNFYAVWLDVRENKKNNICFSTLNGNSTWTKNKIIYRSPDEHVCECCKPSVAVKDDLVSIMFRNHVDGSRDLYVTTSLDKGQTFDDAQKLGTGTWKLNACPMDGGGLTVSSKNAIRTVWRRDGQVFYAERGKPEILIGEGRSCNITGDIINWSNGTDLIVKRDKAVPVTIGKGSALRLAPFTDKRILAVWEVGKQVVYKTID